MYIRKTAKGKYRAHFHIDYYKPSKTFSATSEAKAKKIAQAIEVELQRGIKMEQIEIDDNGAVTVKDKEDTNSNFTFTQLVERWRDKELPSLVQKCGEDWNARLDQHILPIFGDMFISDIKADDIESYLQSLENDGVRRDGKPGGYSAQTIVHHYTVLNLMFNFAIKEKLIKENPCNKEMKPTVITDEARYFDDKTMELLFSKLDNEHKNGIEKWDWAPHYYDGQEVECRPNEIQLEAVKKLVYHMHKIFIRLAFSTTSRRCAMCGLEFGDMDYNRNEIRFQRTSHYSKQKGIYTQTKVLKNKKHNRTIRMPVKYMQEIREYNQVMQETRKLMGDLWVDSDRLFIAYV